MIPLSVIILTKNEEEFIERCIKSVLWADEVLVVDSDSTDKTKEIAASIGAKVYEYYDSPKWTGYAAKRSYATSLAKNDWVFFLDCDEIVTPQLAQSIQAVMNSPMGEQDGYSINRRGDFYDILLPNSFRPSKRLKFVRLFNRRCSGYNPNQRGHEEVLFPGKAIPLQGVLIHWRAHMMDEYIASANRYATMEAEVLNEKDDRVTGLTIFLRPLLRFLWSYIIGRGFLLGTPGLIHAMLEATREYIRYAKLWEMQNVERVVHPPAHIYTDPPIEKQLNDVVGSASLGEHE